MKSKKKKMKYDNGSPSLSSPQASAFSRQVAQLPPLSAPVANFIPHLEATCKKIEAWVFDGAQLPCVASPELWSSFYRSQSRLGRMLIRGLNVRLRMMNEEPIPHRIPLAKTREEADAIQMRLAAAGKKIPSAEEMQASLQAWLKIVQKNPNPQEEGQAAESPSPEDEQEAQAKITAYLAAMDAEFPQYKGKFDVEFLRDPEVFVGVSLQWFFWMTVVIPLSLMPQDPKDPQKPREPLTRLYRSARMGDTHALEQILLVDKQALASPKLLMVWNCVMTCGTKRARGRLLKAMAGRPNRTLFKPANIKKEVAVWIRLAGAVTETEPPIYKTTMDLLHAHAMGIGKSHDEDVGEPDVFAEKVRIKRKRLRGCIPQYAEDAMNAPLP